MAVGQSGIDFDKIYPIGSIYMSVNSIDPKDLFGGTWEQLKDRFLLGCGSKANGTTGGEENHTLSDNEMPSHRHWITSATYDDGNGSTTGTANTQYYGLWADAGGYSADDSWGNYGRYSAWYGGNGNGSSHRDTVAHNNMPPYLTVYMWKRVN